MVDNEEKDPSGEVDTDLDKVEVDGAEGPNEDTDDEVADLGDDEDAGLQIILDKARGAAPAADKSDEKEDKPDENKPEGDAKVDPVAAAQAEAERIVAEAKAEADRIKGVDPNKGTEDGEEDTSATPSIGETWRAARAEIEEGWKEYEPSAIEGEKRLVGFMDKLVDRLEATEAQLAVANELAEQFEFAEQAREGQVIASKAEAAAKQISETYGIEVSVADMIAAAGPGGGFKAYAALHEIDLNDQAQQLKMRRTLTPETFVEAYEIVNRGKLRGARPKPKEEPKKELPNLNRGDGARSRTTPLSEDEMLQATIDAERARVGRR